MVEELKHAIARGDLEGYLELVVGITKGPEAEALTQSAKHIAFMALHDEDDEHRSDFKSFFEMEEVDMGNLKSFLRFLTEVRSFSVFDLEIAKIVACLPLIPNLVSLRVVSSSPVTEAETGSLLRAAHLVSRLAIQAQIESIGPEIGLCKNLVVLDLESNRLVAIDSAIADCRELKELNLRDNLLTGIPPSVFDLERLETLWLSENKITSDISKEILKLGHLSMLSISNNSLEDMGSLAFLPRLKYLYLAHNPITIFPSRLPELESFECSGDQLPQLPTAFGEMPKLRSLSVLKADSDLEVDLSCILGAANLESLVVEAHRVKNAASIAALTKLKKLRLNGGGLTEIPEEWRQLVTLQDLELPNNLIAHIPAFLEELPLLIGLDLQNNQLKFVPDWILGKKKLVRLDISKNPLGDVEVKRVRSLFLGRNLSV